MVLVGIGTGPYVQNLTFIILTAHITTEKTIPMPISPPSRIKCECGRFCLHSELIQEMVFCASLNLRVFNDPKDDAKMWKASVKDIDGEILCVSQFTLLANTTKGNKPDFHNAMVSDAPLDQYGNSFPGSQRN